MTPVHLNSAPWDVRWGWPVASGSEELGRNWVMGMGSWLVHRSVPWQAQLSQGISVQARPLSQKRAVVGAMAGARERERSYSLII